MRDAGAALFYPPLRSGCDPACAYREGYESLSYQQRNVPGANLS
jgi:hypothetical protein